MVVQYARDNSGYFGAMSDDVAHISIVICDVETVNVVDISVVIVVDAIPGDLSRIRVNIVGKIRMSDVDSGIGHRNNNLWTPRSNSPGILGIDVRSDCRNEPVNRVSPVQQCPLPLELRVVRPESTQLDQAVRFSIFDLAAGLQAA